MTNNAEKSTINGAISDLRTGLSNNKIQYTNAEGVVITTTSSSTRKSLEKQLDQAINRQTQINSKVDTLNQRLFDYETEIVEVSINNDIAGELGPLKYLSGLTGIPMDQIINYLLLTIIFVFDPLAIALVIAANFAFAKLIPKTRENIYGEKVVIEEKDDDWDSTLNDGLENEDDGMWTEEEMEDFKEQFNADDALPDDEDEENGFPEGYSKESLEDKQIREDKLLKTSSTSGWRKNKILKERKQREDDDLTINY